MTRMRSLFASLLFAAGCSAAYADQPGMAGPAPAPSPLTALASAPAKLRAPYDVQVIREGGELLPTYQLKDRYYVQGITGDRYIIRVSNPTARRVEAVVTVDGLDVVDGDSGDLKKRGYIVPAYGEVRIEGFRTSTDDVATFRFSSVDGSYAGKQGKARNVGVIAVALFEEEAPPPEQQIVGEAERPRPDAPYDYRGDLDDSGPRAKEKDAPAPSHGADRARRIAPPAAAPPPMPAQSAPSGAGAAVGHAAPSPKATKGDYDGAADEKVGPSTPSVSAPRKTERLGLGTEFGEQRESAVTFTKFVRANNRPVAIAELRYNDGAGLTALGINVQPLPDVGEIMTRETADPFPGDQRFSAPPR